MGLSDSTKYVVYDSEIGGLTMVIFPATMQHSDMAILLGKREEILSAGFLKVDKQTSTACCYGDSFSLQKKADPERDNRLAQRLIFGFN